MLQKHWQVSHWGKFAAYVVTCAVMLSPRPSNHTDSMVVLLVEAIVPETPSAASVEFMTSWASTMILADVIVRMTSTTPD